MNPKCPTCGSDSITLGEMDVSVLKARKRSMLVYQCTNASCRMDIPYPEPPDSKSATWQTEFIMLNGKPHVVRPSASEFA